MADPPPAKRPCSAERALHAVAEGLHCSITGSLLVDPVSAADGQIYERAAITRWLANNDTSPNTGAVLSSKALFALPAVRAMAAQVVEAGTLPDDEAREWLLRKGVLAGNSAEGKELLARAHAMGSVHAGFHYGRLLIRDAAEAGMPEAQAALQRLDAPLSAAEGTVLYVVGGRANHGIGVSSVECFDPVAQAWTAGPAMSVTRFFASAIIL